ncbi:multidrug transporter [Robbsia andropogonis]|uniref:Multidrug transporter n=1 Tax=Robbsia andropogonis TaxID=28092 RepID=A0A0F5K692_9BURK|nr:SMR family transporter [Robbsia andropogonis]KKB65037.1 multidrug transporter [Robbsia andropogonis]MCP1118606.1 SMR family transporter [Robbsia andropogonis]MCP1128073.1 SMR family transporter [Robbsia andropogonis]
MKYLSAIGAYPALALAIAAEVFGTSMLKMSDSFTRVVPTVLTFTGYAIAFYFMSLSMRTVPIGIIYAIWSGAGIVLISLIGWVAFGQRLDIPAIIGIGLIVAGVVVLNLFSKSAAH